MRDGVPVAPGLDVPLAVIVHEAHEAGLAALQARAEKAGTNKDELLAIVSYCAERRCEGEGAACPGCQRLTEQRGIATLDQFISQHREITFADHAARITGPGEATATFASFDHLTRGWAGEAYWFWARRVLRKLHFGIRKAGALESETAAEAPSVILVEPQIPDNIGMVARAMGNFGLYDLRVVNPRDGWPSEKARAVASGAAAIIDQAGLHDDHAAAIHDLHWVCATTARQRDMRKPVLTPEQAAAEMHRRIAQGQRCGIVFGRERNGLTSDEVADADAVVMIPVNSAFASLNLAQATLLMGYEWLKRSDAASLGRVTHYEKPLEPGVYLGKEAPATKQELLGFFEHLEDELNRLGFFRPSMRRHVVVRNLRNMFARMNATGQEVRTLRGIVATLANGKGRRRKQSE